MAYDMGSVWSAMNTLKAKRSQEQVAGGVNPQAGRQQEESVFGSLFSNMLQQQTQRKALSLQEQQLGLNREALAQNQSQFSASLGQRGKEFEATQALSREQFGKQFGLQEERFGLEKTTAQWTQENALKQLGLSERNVALGERAQGIQQEQFGKTFGLQQQGLDLQKQIAAQNYQTSQSQQALYRSAMDKQSALGWGSLAATGVGLGMGYTAKTGKFPFQDSAKTVFDWFGSSNTEMDVNDMDFWLGGGD